MTVLLHVPAASLVPVAPEPFDILSAAFLGAFSSPATRSAYGRDLASWKAWCHRQGADPMTAPRPAVDLYARHLEAVGRSAATVARHLSTLAGVYGYAVSEGVIGSSPVERVKRPRVSDESPRLGLDREEVRAFLNAADAAGPRDSLLSRLLVINALRVSEACSADIEDLDAERGYRILRVVGKAGKKATIPLVASTVVALDAVVGERTSGPLLLDHQAQRLDRHDAARVVRRLARRAGITKVISPHSLRHSAITAALDAGVSLRDVQDFARHADPRTTRRYDRGRDNLDRNAAHALAAWFG